MPGRPRKKLGEAKDIVFDLKMLEAQLWEAMPQQYHFTKKDHWFVKLADNYRGKWSGNDPDKELPYDDRGKAWRDAAHAIWTAGLSVLWLTHLLNPDRPRRPDMREDFESWTDLVKFWLCGDEAEPIDEAQTGKGAENADGKPAETDGIPETAAKNPAEPTADEVAQS